MQKRSETEPQSEMGSVLAPLTAALVFGAGEQRLQGFPSHGGDLAFPRAGSTVVLTLLRSLLAKYLQEKQCELFYFLNAAYGNTSRPDLSHVSADNGLG